MSTADHSPSESSSSSGIPASLVSRPSGGDRAGETTHAGLLANASGLAPSRKVLVEAEAIRGQISEEVRQLAMHQKLLEPDERTKELQQLKVDADLTDVAPALRGSTSESIWGSQLLQPAQRPLCVPQLVSCTTKKRKAEKEYSSNSLPQGRAFSPQEQQEQIFGCALCQVVVATEENFEEHLRSQLHRSADASDLKIKAKGDDGGSSSFFCHFCETSSNGEAAFQEHCHGMQHKAVKERIELACGKSEDTGGPRVPALSPTSSEDALLIVSLDSQTSFSGNGRGVRSGGTSFFCSICKARATGQKQLKQHYQGKKHRTAAEKAKMVSVDGTDEDCKTPTNALLGSDDQAEGDDTAFYCSLCQLRTTSEKQLKEHCEGNKHRDAMEKANLVSAERELGAAGAYTPSNINNGRKMKRKKVKQSSYNGGCGVGSSGEASTAAPTSFFCSICMIRTNSQKTFETHNLGKKHQAKLVAATKDGSGLRCSLCLVTATSRKALAAHINGVKHKAAEKIAAAGMLQVDGRMTL